MIIHKKPTDANNFVFHWTFFRAAREGLEKILRLEGSRRKKILLPAFIGQSSREGSGIFDPVRATNFPHLFYRMTPNLQIDTEDLTSKIEENPEAILLLVHYFGFQDHNLEQIKRIATTNGLLIIEDFAHALFTFWQRPAISFDYGLFSLHKMFPQPDGGAILSKAPWPAPTTLFYDLFRYDFQAIIQRRRTNYHFLLELLTPLVIQGFPLVLLRAQLDDCHVPQTFPILLPNEHLRDALYFGLNEAGYGVVSLYHELIEEIPSSYDTEHEIARCILNLPVHQDAAPQDLSQLVTILRKIINA